MRRQALNFYHGADTLNTDGVVSFNTGFILLLGWSDLITFDLIRNSQCQRSVSTRSLVMWVHANEMDDVGHSNNKTALQLHKSEFMANSTRATIKANRLKV
jgi:hypothetical protein